MLSTRPRPVEACRCRVCAGSEVEKLGMLTLACVLPWQPVPQVFIDVESHEMKDHGLHRVSTNDYHSPPLLGEKGIGDRV